MSTVKGLGSCMVPNDKGFPCGMQIQEGEPIGNVLLGMGGAVVGHKRCVDAFLNRKQQEQRKKVEATMVKRVNQAGAGGHVPFDKAEDAIQGSYPLVPKEKEEDKPNLGVLAAALGVRSVAEIPFEDPSAPVVDPAEFQRVTEELKSQPPRHPTPYAGPDQPHVYAANETVCIQMPNEPGVYQFDPDEAEDLKDHLVIAIRRARSNRPY